MVSTRRSGSLSGNNSKRSSSSDDKPPSPKRQKVPFFEGKSHFLFSLVLVQFLLLGASKFGFLFFFFVILVSDMNFEI